VPLDIQQQIRQVGDTQIAIAATLTRPDGTVVDTTDLTVKFKMISADGTIKVAETSSDVTETDAIAGEVEYSPQAADVDTAGTYYAYFITEDGDTKQDTFPAETGEFQVVIKGAS
jgi:hypothetical protein